MFQICGDVEVVGFPIQNVYRMTYGDENATFEPVNGYLLFFNCSFIRICGGYFSKYYGLKK